MGYQIESNDGMHSSGLEYRSLRTPQWASTWITQGTEGGDSRETIEREYAEDIARIEDAEARYYRCSPSARERADATMAQSADGDWEDAPRWWSDLADAAVEEDGRSKAAAFLGRKGGSTVGRGIGACKVRGDSEHYRALAAKSAAARRLRPAKRIVRGK